MSAPTPFNLEAAMKGHPLVTRDGREAKFVMHHDDGRQYPVIADIDGQGRSFTVLGSYLPGGMTSLCDLFMAPQPEKKEVCEGSQGPDDSGLEEVFQARTCEGCGHHILVGVGHLCPGPDSESVAWSKSTNPTITTDSPHAAISVMDPKTGTVTLRSLLSNLDDTTAHWIVPLVVEIRMGGNLDLDRKYHVALTPDF